jgi:hypothetical protein
MSRLLRWILQNSFLFASRTQRTWIFFEDVNLSISGRLLQVAGHLTIVTIRRFGSIPAHGTVFPGATI